MTKNKRYSSVAEMVRDTAEDRAFADEVERFVSDREVVKNLMLLRTLSNYSQQEIAEAMNCSQSRISKLENGTDDDLRLGELNEYLHALGFNATLRISNEDESIVDRVKYHACSIKRLMDQLAELAQVDDNIAKGVAGFFGEAFFNMVSMLAASAKKLPSRPGQQGEQYIRIEILPAQQLLNHDDDGQETSSDRTCSLKKAESAPST